MFNNRVSQIKMGFKKQIRQFHQKHLILLQQLITLQICGSTRKLA